MQLPIVSSQNTSMLQTKWKSIIDPLLRNPLTQGLILTNVKLTTGVPNSVPHKLGRALVGWIPIGQGNAAELWDSQSTNQTPQLTVILNSSVNVMVNLYVF